MPQNAPGGLIGKSPGGTSSYSMVIEPVALSIVHIWYLFLAIPAR